MLALHSRQLVCLVRLVLLMLTSIGLILILGYNNAADYANVEVSKVMSLANNGNKMFPLWQKGNHENESLVLCCNTKAADISTSTNRDIIEVCKGSAHFVNLRRRMVVVVDSGGNGLFKVLVDSSGRRRSISYV